jgi:hypothetical protein
VSLQRCAHTGAKLADNTTCGGRCRAFPACLPAVSPELARGVVLTLRATLTEHRAAASAHEALDQLHSAINEGLARKVASDRSPPRW